MRVGFYSGFAQLFKDARSKQNRSNTAESSRANWAARGTHHLAKLVRGVGVLLNVPRHSPQESTPFQLVSVSCRRRSCASVSPTSRDGPPTRRPPRQGLRPSPYSSCRGARYSAGVLVRCSGRWRAKSGGGSVGDGAAGGVRAAMPPLLQPGDGSNGRLGAGVAAARRAGPLACRQRRPWSNTPHGESPLPSDSPPAVAKLN